MELLFVVSVAKVVVDDLISDDAVVCNIVDMFNVSDFADVIANAELDVDVIVNVVPTDAMDVSNEADCAGVAIDVVDGTHETYFVAEVDFAVNAGVVSSVVAVGLSQENLIL